MKYTSLPRTFLLFLFYASLLLTVPQYVECEDLYPDEVLDFVGVPVQVVRAFNHASSTIFVPFSTAYLFERNCFENPPVALYIGKLALSVTLLC